MDVKEAVKAAKQYISEVFDAEDIADVGLEEVVFDHETRDWKITIGFSRSWLVRKPLPESLFEGPFGRSEQITDRSYKVICIDDETSEIVSLTDRLLTPAN